MATEKKIQMSQFNGTDYDDLFPRTKAEITIPSITTLNKFSNKTNADEILSQLGDYNLYWWKRRTSRREYSIIKDVAIKAPVAYFWTIIEPSAATVSYSDNVFVNEHNNAQLLNPITKQFPFKEYLWTENIRGKYYMYSNTLYYMNTNSVITENYGQGDANQATVFSSSSSPVYAVLEIKTGNWETLQSVNRNAYPDSGVVNGYEYEFLDIPFKNFVIPTRIEFGNYIGIGLVGVNNPNSLSFSFAPKIVKIFSKKVGTFLYQIPGADEMTDRGYTTEIAINDLTETYTSFGLGRNGVIKKSVDSKTIYWYSTGNAEYQLNTRDALYNYLAIG